MNLDHVLQRADIWRAGQLPARCRAVGSGFDVLDAELPGGGWPRGALTEILLAQQGIGALRLLMPALSQLSQDEDRWICWVAPPWIPYAPALQGSGIELSRVLLVHPGAQQDGLWAVEQSLRSGTCSAVLAWPAIDDSSVLRRLQLAAEAGDATGFLFRPQRFAEHPSPAALRLQLHARRGDDIAVSILKRRGGWAAGPFHLTPRQDHGRPLAVPAHPATAAGRISSQWQ